MARTRNAPAWPGGGVPNVKVDDDDSAIDNTINAGDASVRLLREIWWRQRRLGRTLPAQRGIILIPGGRP